MAKKGQLFLPMFVGDFFAATAEWEGEAEALYALLLMRQWSIGHLPVETSKLARLVKYDPATFERWWPTIGTKFEVQEVDGFGPRLLNLRLEHHRAKSVALSKKNAQSGKKGAAKKWRNDGERHQEPMASATASNGERHSERHKSAINIADGNPSHPIPSHPDPSQSALRAQESRARLRPETNGDVGQQTAGAYSDEAEHAEWEAVAELYPPGAQRADWIGAEKAARQLVEDGHATWDALRAGVTRYAAACRATSRLVTNPVKFFTDRDKPWSQAWPIPAQAAAPKRMRTAHEIAEELDPHNTALGAA